MCRQSAATLWRCTRVCSRASYSMQRSRHRSSACSVRCATLCATITHARRASCYIIRCARSACINSTRKRGSTASARERVSRVAVQWLLNNAYAHVRVASRRGAAYSRHDAQNARARHDAQQGRAARNCQQCKQLLSTTSDNN